MGGGLGAQGDSPAYSAPGGLRHAYEKAPADQYSPAPEKASETLQLSSYHQRLAEIRSRGVL